MYTNWYKHSKFMINLKQNALLLNYNILVQERTTYNHDKLKKANFDKSPDALDNSNSKELRSNIIES